MLVTMDSLKRGSCCLDERKLWLFLVFSTPVIACTQPDNDIAVWPQALVVKFSDIFNLRLSVPCCVNHIRCFQACSSLEHMYLPVTVRSLAEHDA